MKNLGLIAAIGPNNELGIDNHLIWHIKEDLKFYKTMTLNKNIIMGRLTLESMPKKALDGRNPIVITKKLKLYQDKFITFDKIDNLLQYVENTNEEFLVIGGASIYQQFLEYVDYMYLTHVDSLKKLEADCFFPKFDINDWNIQELTSGTEGIYNYQICKYHKKRVLKR